MLCREVVYSTIEKLLLHLVINLRSNEIKGQNDVLTVPLTNKLLPADDKVINW